MAKHAGARQAVIAQNVANADTPGYQARALPSFSQTYQAGPTADMQITRGGHLRATQTTSSRDVINQAEPAPNGNAVSVEEEMMNAVGVSREHNRALTIYRHAMTVLRTSLGRQ